MDKKIRRLAALALILALLCPLGGCKRETPSAGTTIFAMDTVMDLALYGDREDTCTDVLRQAVEEIYALDAALDVTDETSALYALNHAGGAPMALSGDTAALLDSALALCALTDGALDITAYPAVRAWGFTTGEYRVPSQEELDGLAARIDYTAVEKAGDAYTLPAGMELDLGAAAKGFTADRLESLLAENGISSALLDLGQSTIFAKGERPGGGRWRIGLRDPAGEGHLAVVELSGHMSTSGGYQRFFEENGTTYWHIIDPTTAAPARSGLASVTVIGPSGLLCDGLSTALFVMGPERGAEFWRAHRDLGFDVVFIEDSGKISITPGLEDRFTLAEGYEGREVTVLS